MRPKRSLRDAGNRVQPFTLLNKRAAIFLPAWIWNIWDWYRDRLQLLPRLCDKVLESSFPYAQSLLVEETSKVRVMWYLLFTTTHNEVSSIRIKVIIMKSLALCFVLVFAVYGSELNLKSSTKGRSTEVNVTESQRENIETVAIKVRRVHVDRDQNGNFEDATMLKVCKPYFFDQTYRWWSVN